MVFQNYHAGSIHLIGNIPFELNTTSQQVTVLPKDIYAIIWNYTVNGITQ